MIGNRELSAELVLVASLLDEKQFGCRTVVAAVKDILGTSDDGLVDRVASSVRCAAPDEKAHALEGIQYNLRMMTSFASNGDGFNVEGFMRSLNALMKDVKEYQRAEKSVSVARGPVQDAIEAYGDIHKLKTRNLSWRGQFVSSAEVQKVMQVSVPDGYNGFNAKKVSGAVAKFSAYKWAFAREGSPALYCKGIKTKDEVLKLFSEFEDVDADELHVIWKGKYYSRLSRNNMSELPEDLSGALCRFWWD